MISVCDDLRKSVLQAAIQGKLTKQLPEDGNAKDLYKEIQAEKQRLIKEGKIKKAKPLPEITDDDIPFDIPENWKWCRLQDVAYVNGGFAFKSTNFRHEGTRVIRISDFNENGFVNFKIVRHQYDETLSQFLIEEKDILLCMTGGTVGKSYFVKSLPERLIANQRVATIKIINPIKEYINFVIVAPHTQSIIQDSKNSTNDNISMETINSFLIPLPPLAEQKRIVARVDELMKRIDDMEKTEKNIISLYGRFPGDMKASLLQAAIQGKLTEQLPEDGDAEYLYKQIQEEKQRLIKEGKIKKDKNESYIFRRDNSHYEKLGASERCIDDEIPFEIPMNWKWVHISEIGTLVRGSGIQKHDTTSTGKQCVRYGEIYTSYYHAFFEANTFTTEQVFARCKHIRNSDLIFTLTGENKPDIAKTIAYLGNDEIAVGGDLAIWSNHYCNPKYLSYFMNSNFAIEQKVNVATGDIIVHISCDKVGRFLMPLPPIVEQNRIVKKLDQLLPICEELNF